MTKSGVFLWILASVIGLSTCVPQNISDKQCLRLSRSPAAFSVSRQQCNGEGGSLLQPRHLVTSQKLSQEVRDLMSLTPGSLWFTDVTEDVGSNVNCSTFESVTNSMTRRDCNVSQHHYVCLYATETCGMKNGSESSTVVPYNHTTNTGEVWRDPGNENSHRAMIIIITVYISSVVIIIVIGIVIVQVRNRTHKDVFVPYVARRRRPCSSIIYAIDYPRHPGDLRHPGHPSRTSGPVRIRNLSDVSESEEASPAAPPGVLQETLTRTHILTGCDLHEAFDFHAERERNGCPPTPELYTPLLNPGQTGGMFFTAESHDPGSVGFDYNGDSMNNPVYEPFVVTSRM